MTNTTKNIHEGRNIKRFREMLGIKQDALAWQLGEDWNQQRISLLEQKETVDPALLQQISEVMKIPVEAFKNFDEEAAISVIANTFTDSFNNSSNPFAYNNHCTFNPLDKVIELFERLLTSEREKVELMKEILEKIK